MRTTRQVHGDGGPAVWNGHHVAGRRARTGRRSSASARSHLQKYSYFGRHARRGVARRRNAADFGNKCSSAERFTVTPWQGACAQTNTRRMVAPAQGVGSTRARRSSRLPVSENRLAPRRNWTETSPMEETRLPSRLRRPRRRRRGHGVRRRRLRVELPPPPPPETPPWPTTYTPVAVAAPRPPTTSADPRCNPDLSLDHAYDAVFDGADAYGGNGAARGGGGGAAAAGVGQRLLGRVRGRVPEGHAARQGEGRPPPQPRRRGCGAAAADGGAAVAGAGRPRRPPRGERAALADARRRRRRRGGGGQWWQRAAQVRVVRATADAVVRAASPRCRLLIWAQADRGAASGGGGGGGGRPRRRRAAAGGRPEPDAVGRAVRS